MCSSTFDHILQPIKDLLQASIKAKPSSSSSSSSSSSVKPIRLKLIIYGGGARSVALCDAIKQCVKASVTKHNDNAFEIVEVDSPQELVVTGAALATKFGWV
jgi:hypothetical protein